MDNTHSQLDELVAQVRQSAKYRAVGEEIVRHIGARELAARRSLREAIKATKNKLHQIGGAYLDTRPPYDDWLLDLRAAAQDGDERLRAACLAPLRHHASTRERVPILERFYSELWRVVPRPASLLDLACGLNPLALPWMGLAAGATYHACDIYADMVAFVASFLALVGQPGGGFVCDLVARPPELRADVALALKLLPVLEQRDKGAGIGLLRALNARHVVVSYPSASLGGRSRGMAEGYERHFSELVAAEPWTIERLVVPGELVFVITKE